MLDDQGIRISFVAGVRYVSSVGPIQRSVQCVLAIDGSVPVGCGAASLSDWCPVFTESVVALYCHLHMLTFQTLKMRILCC